MLPDYLSGAEWLSVFELCGFAPYPGDANDPDDRWLYNTGEFAHGPPAGFWFGASEFAQVEVTLVVDFLCSTQYLDEDVVLAAIEKVVNRREPDSGD